MTIAKAFVSYLETIITDGAFGENIFIGGAAKETSKDDIYWIISNGGAPASTNVTGQKIKTYVLSLYFRSKSAEAVDEALQNLEETINIDQCTQLEGFDTIDMEATSFASDQDLDNQDRTIGLVQVTITTYL